MASSYDTVVIGGGIVGIAAARLLAQKGLSCVVLEKDSVGSHASGFAYGGLHPYSGSDIPGHLTGMARKGFELHQELAVELPGATGVDTEYRRKSTLSLAFTEQQVQAQREHLAWMQTQNADAEWLDGDGLRAAEPRVSPQALGAVLNASTAEVEPYKFLLALAQNAESLGVEILNRTATGMTRSAIPGDESNRATGVTLDNGDVLACGSVLLAAGPWTEALGLAANRQLELSCQHVGDLFVQMCMFRQRRPGRDGPVDRGHRDPGGEPSNEARHRLAYGLISRREERHVVSP